MLNDLSIGSVILDNGVFGIVSSIVESGVWTEVRGFHLTKTYEIRYSDNLVSVITEKTMSHLLNSGRIKIVA